MQAVNSVEDSVMDTVSAQVGESSSMRRLAACFLISHGIHRKGPLYRGRNGKTIGAAVAFIVHPYCSTTAPAHCYRTSLARPQNR